MLKRRLSDKEQTGWFDTDACPTPWQGPFVSRNGRVWQEKLYQTPRGEWVRGSVYDRRRCWGPCEDWYVQLNPQKAAEWLQKNGHAPPEALCAELDGLSGRGVGGVGMPASQGNAVSAAPGPESRPRNPPPAAAEGSRVRDERQRPAVYLMNWPQILDALGLKDNQENRERLRRLSEFYDGPIVSGGQGSSPTLINRAVLIAWWNGLEEQHQERAQREKDASATVDEQYQHGRGATVVPGISGEMKKRRRKGR
jgi:hypothetical protein